MARDALVDAYMWLMAAFAGWLRGMNAVLLRCSCAQLPLELGHPLALTSTYVTRPLALAPPPLRAGEQPEARGALLPGLTYLLPTTTYLLTPYLLLTAY